MSKNDTFTFKEKSSKCRLSIQRNHLNNSKWMFGTMFIHKYISYFDYEKKLITFYSTNNLDFFNENNNPIIPIKKRIIFMIIFILFPYSILIFIIKNKLHIS